MSRCASELVNFKRFSKLQTTLDHITLRVLGAGKCLCVIMLAMYYCGQHITHLLPMTSSTCRLAMSAISGGKDVRLLLRSDSTSSLAHRPIYDTVGTESIQYSTAETTSARPKWKPSSNAGVPGVSTPKRMSSWQTDRHQDRNSPHLMHSMSLNDIMIHNILIWIFFHAKVLHFVCQWTSSNLNYAVQSTTKVNNWSSVCWPISQTFDIYQ